MNNKEIIELTNILDAINADLYNQCTTLNKRGKEETDPWLSMTMTYWQDGECIVEFLGETIYNTENEEREFDREKNEYEPMEPWLRKKANEFINKLQKIKL